MNIKEHIEAGHYPKDSKGRALVPMKNGRTATIYATDFSYGPIAGADKDDLDHWNAEGHYHIKGGGYSPLDLLPPPPRKVKVDVLAVVIAGTSTVLHVRNADDLPAGVAAGIERLVRLTGEYEEPWS